MFQALIFDSYYDKHRGVIAYIRIFLGEIKANTKIYFLATDIEANLLEVGYFLPGKLQPSEKLEVGEIGYLVTGQKDIDKVRVGDTISDKNNKDLILPGYKEVEPKVFSSIFPVEADDYPKLKDALAKLKLNDSSLIYETEHIPALGFGFRCGFLGLLHMDVVQERLSREFDLELVITTPTVKYKVIKFNGEEIVISTSSLLPDPSQIKEILEPFVELEIITPEIYVGKILESINQRRGSYSAINLLAGTSMQVVAIMPLAEMIVDFYDELKSISQGFATMSYQIKEYRSEKLVKIDILVNKKIVDPLAIIVHKSQAENKSRQICKKLKELIPKQQFEIAIQAGIGSKIIARETISAFRKDVTAKLYGGDITRRMKLLEKQKKGKKRMKMVGNVEIPQSAFLNVLKK